MQALLTLCTTGALPALPDGWWRAWSLAPVFLLLLAGLLAAGWRATQGAAGRRRLFAAGWLLLAVALVSPLCRLAATLAAAHMAQVMLLVVAVPLLLALACPPPAAGGRPTRPALWAGLYGAGLWLWHWPPVYQASLLQPAVHIAVYGAALALAFLFWHSLVHAAPGRRMAALLPLALTAAHTGLLGALLTFAASAWYPAQAAGARAWGLSPLEDQQLAGLLMWVPGSLAYGLAALALAWRWQRPLDPRLPPGRYAIDS